MRIDATSTAKQNDISMWNKVALYHLNDLLILGNLFVLIAMILFFILCFFILNAKFDAITTGMQFEKSAASVMKFTKYC